MDTATERDTAEVLAEIEQVIDESGFGSVLVTIVDGRIDRIDRCVQKKLSRPTERQKDRLAKQNSS